MEPKSNETELSITGNATIIRQPDVGYVTLYIRGNGVLLEDAIKDASDKIEQVNKTLRDTFSEINETFIIDIYVGESKSYFGREKAESPQPEVIKGLLVITPPDPNLTTKIVDKASRMGCLIQNPAEERILIYPRGVVTYGLAQYEEAEDEAIESALSYAKDSASRVAKIMNKKVGSIRRISSVETLRTQTENDTYTRRVRNVIVFPTNYLSPSPKSVEIFAKLSVTFELVD